MGFWVQFWRFYVNRSSVGPRTCLSNWGPYLGSHYLVPEDPACNTQVLLIIGDTAGDKTSLRSKSQTKIVHLKLYIAYG